MSAWGTFENNGSNSLWSYEPNSRSSSRFPAEHDSFGLEPLHRSLNPKIVGGSVLGLQFRDGAVIAADTLGSYGTLARYRNCERLFKVNDSTVIGVSGDFADFQYLKGLLEQQVIFEECLNDGFGFTPQSLHCLLTRLMYSRRDRFNPLWNTIIIAGLEDDRPFTGYVDFIGTAYESPSVACGYGAYLAQPIMRDALEKNPDLSAEDAVRLIDRCMKVLYYRDALAFYRYQIAIITRDGVMMQGPVHVQTNWETAHMVTFTGYVDLIGTAYESPSVACGYGAYIAQPIMRDALEQNPDLSAEEAARLIDRCMKLLYYRDALAFYRYQMAIITRDGVIMQGPVHVQTNWETVHMVTFTCYVDLIGTAYETPSVACGYGAYKAQPIMRDALEKNPDLSAEDAVRLIDRCMKLLYYRDALAFYRYQMAIITTGGVIMQGPVHVQTNWETAHMVTTSLSTSVSFS